ncbi:PTS sugar transporter subunit IIA [Pullulanibacillus sp. KACC 23026]|uniref:PTS sugar transporter subunit IIA n=1 Tax=Pullulanibacillus sp. KACC 23026 TaxID=3028315 RepID=UPI0023B0AF30|nr:PTS sugar transporter subunit IIA [Pullulanibacillus sp. KACC 23026]WEG12892.1 PTS sugar transporter subunit IIA [Pullulanibacillus sp. KACC 23026]
MAFDVLALDNIQLNASASDKKSAIKLAGDLLVEHGYVDPSYVDKMYEREELTSTYMGNFVAIPHGTEDAKQAVKHSGISIVQIPEGVDFGGGNIVKLVFGIAGKNNEHLDILSKIAIVCSEEENVQKLIEAKTKEDIVSLFEGVAD